MIKKVSWQTSKGFIDYQYAVDEMESYINQIILENAQEKIWLLEHDHIYTMGVSAKESDILDIKDYKISRSNRGGKITYHGPGMRIIYTMLNLNYFKGGKDIRKFITALENWIINSLNHLSIDAFVREDRVGIWVMHNNQEKKIGAIGIRLRKWVSYHGIAININPDLKMFQNIVPCGIHSKNYGVTSLREMGIDISFSDFDKILKTEFSKQFNKLIA
ncbi:MAG: lipoyl(octanoyl) transferase LipB [Rickettsiales bacterium]|nr:lipoyl(octanoyl) transferase LipB [Rickettsiales bacterium]